MDVLVNNAGMGMLARFEDVTDLSLYERLMRVNYLGSVYPTYYALPHLKKSRGQIVAVSSLAGLTGVPMRTAYAATKHAQVGFFDSLRDRAAGHGVSVTVVRPYFVQSEIRERSPGPDGRTGRGLAGEGGRDHERRGVRAARWCGPWSGGSGCW